METTRLEASAWAIGVDVGGTKVAAGFVDPRGEIHQHTRVAMNSHGTAAEGLAAVTAAIDELHRRDHCWRRRCGHAESLFRGDPQAHAWLVLEQTLPGDSDCDRALWPRSRNCRRRSPLHHSCR